MNLGRPVLRQLRARPRLLSAFVIGGLTAAAWPHEMSAIGRALLGWNLGVWLYLLLAIRMMVNADRAHLQRHAVARADGVGAVLLLSIVGAAATLCAIAMEQSRVKHGQDLTQGWSHLGLALSTVAGTWLFLPVEFAMAYASLYHKGQRCHGLDFPGTEDEADGPDYLDFLYFSVTVAACAQTSDVAVNSRSMRRLVLLHTVMAFAFNTGILALTINILAGLFG